MLRVFSTLFATLILLSCTTTPNRYEALARVPTPEAWKRPGLRQFHIVDPDRNWLGSLVLDFTVAPADTCTEGDWKLARLMSSSADISRHRGPSFVVWGTDHVVGYLIEGANLMVDLNGNICDSNHILVGELHETEATGRFEYSSLAGLIHLGWFTAAPTYNP